MVVPGNALQQEEVQETKTEPRQALNAFRHLSVTTVTLQNCGPQGLTGPHKDVNFL